MTRTPSRAAFISILFVWFGAYVGARLAIPNLATGSPLRLVAALAPIAPSLAVLWLVWRWAGGLDELHRRVQLEALAVAFTLSIVMLWVLGLLEQAIELDRDNWSYRHVWAFMPMFYFVGLALSWRRYA